MLGRTRIEGGVILYRMVRKGLKSWEADEEVMLTFGRRIFWVEGVFEESRAYQWSWRGDG